MVLYRALVGGLVLAGHAAAKVNDLHALLHRSDDLEDILRRDTDLLASLTVRQDANGAAAAPQISSTPASGDAAKADLAKWEEQTQAACNTALSALNGVASNPTGIAVCYNLPFLDNTTGVFQAELRMYNISAPIDPWTGIVAADVNMALSYLGATLQEMNVTNMQKRDDIFWPPIRARDDGSVLVQRQSTAPQQLKVLNYVGKINSNLMGTAMTQATLQPLLVPVITLTAKGKSGEDLSATLSSSEASFVNGVFAKQSTTTALPASAAAASASAAVASTTPFFLPGTNLAFFPTGLVVTCVWTAGLILAVGLGTLGRIQFREQYRRRVKREASAGYRTI